MKKIRIITIGSALLVASLATAHAASTQDTYGSVKSPTKEYAQVIRDGIAADGRCGGVSYGTGARRCDTMTGGPVGGPGIHGN